MKIGIIKEGKTPPDSRVPLTPAQCSYLIDKFDLDIIVQPSQERCFSDREYQDFGIHINDNINDCDVLLGVKEVPIGDLLPDKTYFFFSHTIKEQAYNRQLLQAIIQKNIHLIDYEVLTNDKGQRLIAFGKFAGMVGAHNGVMVYGWRSGKFDLPRMKDCKDYEEAKRIYSSLVLPSFKIVLTGTGRVASGAAEVLRDLQIKKIEPKDFLTKTFPYPVFTQLDCDDYAERKDGHPFDLDNFFSEPQEYKSIFQPYYELADVMINGIYWDNQAPVFFTKEEMGSQDFNIKVIADVTCDIAPISSIPSTLRASTIAEPVFGYDPVLGKEVAPHGEKVIDMMTIDNLPNELPRDASQAFGQQFTEHIIEELLEWEKSDVIERATVAQDGHLGKHFSYLKGYLEGKGQD